MQKTSNDPLHGKTLQMIIEYLVDRYSWDGLGKRIKIKCFTSHPTVASSLTFLRKTPWAREKVEELYLASIQNSRAKKAALEFGDLEL